MKKGHSFLATNGAKPIANCWYNKIRVRISKSVKLHSLIELFYI